MNTPKDDHTVTSSPLMRLKFIVIQTCTWPTLCRNTQNLLISCPAGLVYR